MEPDRRPDRRLAEVANRIARHGHAVQYTAPCPDGCCGPGEAHPGALALGYTVGLGFSLWPGRRYELAVTGQPAEESCLLLNHAATTLVLDGLEPAEGLLLDGQPGGGPVRLRRARDPAGCATLAAFYETWPPVWQLLLPDAVLRFPGDPGYDLPPAAQPLL